MMDRRFSRDLDTPNWSECSKKNVIDYFAGDRTKSQWNVNNRTSDPRLHFHRPVVTTLEPTIPNQPSRSSNANEPNDRPVVTTLEPTIPNQPSRSSNANEPNETSPSDTSPGSKKTLLIVFAVIGVILLLVAIIAIVYFVTKKKADTKPWAMDVKEGIPHTITETNKKDLDYDARSTFQPSLVK